MPFKSEKQRRFLWAEHPEIAKRWADKYPESNKGLPMYASDKTDKNDETSSPKEKAAQATITPANTGTADNKTNSYSPQTPVKLTENIKVADSKQERVDIPHSEKPTYAGEERQKGMISGGIDTGKNVNESCGKNAINELLQKISVVLAPAVEQTMENMQAEREGRVPRRVGRNSGLKSYPLATPQIPLPMGMQQPQAGQPQQAQQSKPASPTPVGAGQSSATTDPIKFHSGLSASGIINGNAALSAPNTVNTKISADAAQKTTLDVIVPQVNFKEDVLPAAYRSLLGAGVFGGAGLRTGALLGGLGGTLHGALTNPGEYVDAQGKKQKRTRLQKIIHDALAGVGIGGVTGGALGATGGAIVPFLPVKQSAANNSVLSQLTSINGISECDIADLLELEADEMDRTKLARALAKWAGTPAWQRAAGKNDEGGLNAKGRASYNRATGGNLKAPVTEKNPSGDRAKRQNSFCSRMCGMKKHETGSKTKKDPDSRINKSLRKWNCKCSGATEFGLKCANALDILTAN